MQTRLPDHLLQDQDIAEADAILRSCVHCGFCNATCPTYQLTGSELDGPRGRIYLMKEMLESGKASTSTQLHLDRCLTCRACETTCPSGVRYARLAEIGRGIIERKLSRPLPEQLLRKAIREVLPDTGRLSLALNLGHTFRSLLPESLRRKVPLLKTAPVRNTTRHQRRMLILEGCIQPLSAPATNAVAVRVLDHLGISLISARGAGCCGALNQHMSDEEKAHTLMRRNIDAWWPHIESGVEAIVMTASGCGLMVKEYGAVLKHDPRYAEKAVRISQLTRDLSEILDAVDLTSLAHLGKGMHVAFQSPCTLQHGQKLGGKVESILHRCGYRLTEVPDGHLCCGAAGTYTLLQPELSERLLKNKLAALNSNQPEVIATANIGCQLHLAAESRIPVKHWIELLDTP